MKKRPKSLHAVYVEPGQIEVLHARRPWRNWEIESTARFKVHEGESVMDALRHRKLRPWVKKGSALLLFLPSTFYSTHREHYPLSMKRNIEEAIAFDWQENIFYEQDRTIYFYGPLVTINQRISVPVFSLLKQTFDKFYQAANGQLYDTFNVVPSVLASEAFLPSLVAEGLREPLEFVARILDASHIEIHRFYHGSFLDSVVIRKSFQSLSSFLENLHCLGDVVGESCVIKPHVHLLCTEAELAEKPDYGTEWIEEGLPIQLHKLEGCLVNDWVRRLLRKNTVHTFDGEIVLKPWKVPSVVWPLMAIVLFFAAYALCQVQSVTKLAETSMQLKKQISRLETEWKQIEELQKRISTFQEDRENLFAFDGRGYPMLQLMNLLSEVTPEDTWLNSLSLREGKLSLRVESKSASRYL